MDGRALLFLMGVLIGCPLAAQSPGRAVPDALQALTGGKHGCGSTMEVRDTTITYFPNVRFIRGYCTGEHGDPMSGIVALDSDSVLYLFSSSEALGLLLARHPIARLDSASVLDYASVALELTGYASGHSRRVERSNEGGPELRRALHVIRDRVAIVIPRGIPRPTEWNVLFGRTEPAYENRRAFLTEIWIRADGNATVMRDSLVTPLPVH